MGELVEVLELCNKQKKKFFFDMDGVLAKWQTDGDPTKPGFFLSRQLEERVRDLIKALVADGYSVTILSAVYVNGYAEKEKVQWLADNGLENIPHLFVPYGSNKSAAIKKSIKNDQYILVDDYTENLKQWDQAGHTAVKFLNGKNNTKGTWLLNGGRSINKNMSVDEMKTALLEIPVYQETPEC